MRRRNRPGLIRGRAIAPNAGLEAEYQRRLQKFVREMSRSVEYWLSAEYRRQEPRIELYNAPPDTVPDRSVPGMPHDPQQTGQILAAGPCAAGAAHAPPQTEQITGHALMAGRSLMSSPQVEQSLSTGFHGWGLLLVIYLKFQKKHQKTFTLSVIS